MSNTPTVPVFDPNGVLRDVPQDQLPTAVKNKGVPAVRFQAPDGTIKFVPATRISEAVQNQGKLLPIEQQDVQHSGFWHSLASDLSGLLHPSGVSPYPGMDQDTKAAMAGQSFEQDQARRAAGYTAPYRALAPVAQSVGVNVPGMEQSAAEGDVAGVVGHAAAPVAVMGAGEALAHGAPMAAKASAPAVRAAIRTINAGLEKAPGSIGGAAGAAAGGYIGGHLGAEIGGAAGFALGREVLPRVRVPGEGFGLPDRVTGGPATAPPYTVYPGASLPENPGVFPGATLPEVPSRQLLQANSLLRGPQPIVDTAAGLGQIPVRPAGTAGSMAESVTQPTGSGASMAASATPSGVGLPRTLSGESALSQVLSKLDNGSLLKIAKSRGINVSQESLLKPGSANGLLIKKIANDFGPDELQEFGSKYLETSRFEHQFPSDMSPEAWSTIALQNYFPSIKVPLAQLRRAAIEVQRK